MHAKTANFIVFDLVFLLLTSPFPCPRHMQGDELSGLLGIHTPHIISTALNKHKVSWYEKLMDKQKAESAIENRFASMCFRWCSIEHNFFLCCLKDESEEEQSMEYAGICMHKRLRCSKAMHINLNREEFHVGVDVC